MSFTRTNSGISNGHLFHDAELIVYTEGGQKSFSLEDIENGNFNTKSIDIRFWQGLFCAAKFKKKVEFRALGSKTSSKKIREKILSNKVKNVAVVVDRDLDFVVSPPVESPFILYTKGYSWENDVYSKSNTLNQIDALILEQKFPESIRDEVASVYSDYSRIGKRLLKLEVLFRLQGEKFVTEVRGERFFDSKRLPLINKKQIALLVQEKKRSLNNRPVSLNCDITHLCPLENNYGKLLAALSISLVNYICKKHTTITSIPLRILESAMVERYLNEQNLNCDNYYKTMIQKLEAA